MAFFGTTTQPTKINLNTSSLIKRIVERMVEGQEMTAINIINAHLKSLPDDILKDYGYSDFEIQKIREAKESCYIF